MDVGCSKWWFIASAVTPQHIWAPPYPNFSKFDPYLHRYNRVEWVWRQWIDREG